MMAIVPSLAPRGPPLTGASIKSTLPGASSRAIARVAFGSPVVISAINVPVAALLARPSLENTTCRTSLDDGKHVNMTSDRAANSSGPAAAAAPCSLNAATRSTETSKTVEQQPFQSGVAPVDHPYCRARQSQRVADLKCSCSPPTDNLASAHDHASVAVSRSCRTAIRASAGRIAFSRIEHQRMASSNPLFNTEQDEAWRHGVQLQPWLDRDNSR